MLFPEQPQLTDAAQEVLTNLPVVRTALHRSSRFVTAFVVGITPRWSIRHDRIYSEPLAVEMQAAQQQIAEEYLYEQLPVPTYR